MQGKTLAGMLIFTALVSLDQTILASALPIILKELKGNVDYSWLATSYLLPSTIVLPIAGKLVDLVEGRRFFLSVCALFLASSALAGSAMSLEQLVAYRAIQGLAGGAMLSAGMGLVGLVFDSKERGKVIGLFSAVSGIAAVLGPPAGGLIAEYISWRWIFWVNIAPGLLGLGMLALAMPTVRSGARGVLDWTGSLLLIMWTVPLLLVTSLAGERYAWTSLPVLLLSTLAFVGLFLFARRQLRATTPLLDLALFRDRVFLGSSLSMFFLGGANLVVVFYLPLYLVSVRHYSTSVAGMVLGAEALLFALGSGLAEALGRRLGLKKMLLLSCSILVAGVAGLAFRLGPSTSLAEIVFWLGLEGLAFGLALPAFISGVQDSVPRDQVGSASGNLQFFRLLGSSLFTALLGALLASSLAGGLSEQESLRRLFAQAAIPAVLSLTFLFLLPAGGRSK